MIINLGDLPWQLSHDIVDYCWENQIESRKCWDFLFQCSQCGMDQYLTLDIPHEHVTWILLKYPEVSFSFSK